VMYDASKETPMVDCVRCLGTGKVPRFRASRRKGGLPSCTGSKPCPNCRGTGRVPKLAKAELP